MAIYHRHKLCGHLPAAIAKRLRGEHAAATAFDAQVAEILTGGGGRGIRITVLNETTAKPAAHQPETAPPEPAAATVTATGTGRTLGTLVKTNTETGTVTVRNETCDVNYPAHLVNINKPDTPTTIGQHNPQTERETT